jgi:hypothetical protein
MCETEGYCATCTYEVTKCTCTQVPVFNSLQQIKEYIEFNIPRNKFSKLLIKGIDNAITEW